MSIPRLISAAVKASIEVFQLLFQRGSAEICELFKIVTKDQLPEEIAQNQNLMMGGLLAKLQTSKGTTLLAKGSENS